MHNRGRRLVQALKFSRPKEDFFTCFHCSVLPIVALDVTYNRNTGVGSRGVAEILIIKLKCLERQRRGVTMAIPECL
jgi:hypothetical protein